MKVNIYKDERWPDYGMTKPRPHDRTIEISDEVYARIGAVEKAYEAIQSELAELYKAQK